VNRGMMLAYIQLNRLTEHLTDYNRDTYHTRSRHEAWPPESSSFPLGAVSNEWLDSSGNHVNMSF
jgi:hypothetical protein